MECSRINKRRLLNAGTELSEKDATYFRSYMILALTLSNAGRAGVVANMELQEFEAARAQSNRWVTVVSTFLLLLLCS